jgi:type IV pilus assembly protein PilN
LRWGLGLVVLLLVTVVLVYSATSALLSWRTTEKRAALLRQQIAERDHQKQDVEKFLGLPENREMRDRSQFLNGMIARKAFSWTEVFTDLETLVPARLHVLAIRPEVNEDNQLVLRLGVAGSSRDAAIELVRRLEHSPHFQSAQIDSESAVLPQPGQSDTVHFEISAVYIPDFARPQKVAAGASAPPPTAAVSPTSTAVRKPPRPPEGRNAGHE